MAEGKIVKVVKSGGVTMYFHDDYCKDKTPEEVKAILDRIAKIAYPALKSAHIRKEKTGPA
jgi:hypothetical protein